MARVRGVCDEIRDIGRATAETSTRAEEGKKCEQNRASSTVFRVRVGNDVNDDEDIPTTEIRVGRTSEDNDIVSLDPTNDPNEWWMHAAGCPGSHVVIKSTAPSGAAFFDAALLAAKFSKASRVGRVKVSVVRCRQVSKPKGAKPGLVRLSGDVRTMEVRVDENLDRLEMLERTKT